MPQMQQPRLTEIVLLDDKVPGGPRDNIVGAVQRYVWEMNQRGVADSLLPPEAIKSSYVEYYCHEVQNGNIGQFVINSRWLPQVVNGVRTGLAAMGMMEQAQLFEDVVRFVEATKSDLSAALASNEPEGKGSILGKDGQRFQVIPQAVIGKHEGDSFGEIIAASMQGSGDAFPSLGPRATYRKRLDAIRGGFFKAFAAHPNGHETGVEQIRVANANWICSWRNVRLVAPEQYALELDRLAAPIPGSRRLANRPKQKAPFQPDGANSPQTGKRSRVDLRAVPKPTIWRRWQGPSNYIGLWIYFAIAGIAAANTLAPLADITLPDFIVALSSRMLAVAILIGLFYLINLIYLVAMVAAATAWRSPIMSISLGFGPAFLIYRGKWALLRLAMLPWGSYLALDPDRQAPWVRLSTAVAGPSSLVILAWVMTGLPPLEQAHFLFNGLVPLISHPLTVPKEFWSNLISFIGQNSPALLFGYMCVCFGVFNFLPLPLLNGGAIIAEMLRITRIVRGEPLVYKVMGWVSFALLSWLTGMLLVGLFQSLAFN